MGQNGNQISPALQVEVQALARKNLDDGRRAAGMTMLAEHQSESGFTFTDKHGEEHFFDFASCTKINFRWAQYLGVRTICDSRSYRLYSDSYCDTVWC